MGAEVLDADRLAHRFLEPQEASHRRIIEAFGPDVLNGAGRIDRKALGRKVFDNRENLNRLNAIVHPLLLAAIRERIREFRAREPEGLLAIDAALLFQWGLEKDCDWVLWVDAPVEIRRERTVAAGRMDEAEFDRRDRLQKFLFDRPVEDRRIVKLVNIDSEFRLRKTVEGILKEVVNYER
jgi:dephospho-CoA kinase